MFELLGKIGTAVIETCGKLCICNIAITMYLIKTVTETVTEAINEHNNRKDDGSYTVS